jgi:hypothetical protein
VTGRGSRSHQLVGALSALIAVVLLGGFVTLVVDDDGGVPASGARATAVDGVTLVVHTDGSSSPIETGEVVLAGDEVRVRSGTVVLELASGAVLEGREESEGVDATRVRIGAAPQLVAGDLLVDSGVPVVVGAGGNDVSFEPDGSEGAAARIRRGLSVTVGLYRGTAALDSAGQERAVPAYRQLSVASLGRPPASPDPLRLDPTDGWDLRYLGIAFELTRRLDALSGTYTANLGLAGATAEALEAVVPALADEPDFGPELLTAGGRMRPGGESLVGVSIALLGRADGFASRFERVRGFRADGAEWGLVALDQGVAEARLVAAVEAAYARAIQPSREAAAPVPDGTPAVTPTTVAAPICAPIDACSPSTAVSVPAYSSGAIVAPSAGCPCNSGTMTTIPSLPTMVAPSTTYAPGTTITNPIPGPTGQ